MAEAALAPVHRSDEILDLIRGTFAEKGFDGASMQDLARAAGMSVGNFYRYFPSKAAIVEAIVLRDLDHVRRDFDDILAAPDPMQRLREVLCHRIEVETCKGDPSLWAEITAMAHRRPEIGAICAGMEAEIARLLVEIFARVCAIPSTEAQRHFGAHAALLVLLVKAWSLDGMRAGGAGSDLKPLLLRTIQMTLDEVARSKAKG